MSGETQLCPISVHRVSAYYSEGDLWNYRVQTRAREWLGSRPLSQLPRKRRTRHFYSRVNLEGEALWNWSGAFCALQMHARARTRVLSGSMREDRLRSRERERTHAEGDAFRVREPRNVPLIKSHD